jgi:hemoglobin
MDLLDTQLYGLIGEAGFSRLVAAFYERVPEDDILGPLYSRSDLLAAELRLRDFLIGRFGGPEIYIQRRGHPRLRMRHARFRIDAAAQRRWIELMESAMARVALPPEAEALLRPFFQEAAKFLINVEG